MARGRQTGTKRKRRGTKGWRVEAWRKNPHCHYCGTRIPSPSEASTDHKVPLSAGGYSKRRNYLLSCHPCNRAKGSKSYEVFVTQHERSD